MSDLDRMAVIMNELAMTNSVLQATEAYKQELSQQLNVMTGDSNGKTSNCNEREEADSGRTGTGTTAQEY